MDDIAPPFDPATWAQRWIALGGDIDCHGLRWPFPVWLSSELRTARDDLRDTLLALTPQQGDALRTWAINSMGWPNG